MATLNVQTNTIKNLATYLNEPLDM